MLFYVQVHSLTFSGIENNTNYKPLSFSGVYLIYSIFPSTKLCIRHEPFATIVNQLSVVMDVSSISQVHIVYACLCISNLAIKQPTSSPLP